MRMSVAAGKFGTFTLAAASTCAVALNATDETSRPLRLGAILVVLLIAHAIRFRRVWISRELGTYLLFVLYLLLSLLWTEDVALAGNTLALVFDFILVALLFGNLVFYHDRGATFGGCLAGFLLGAAVYTLTKGFPLSYPDDFSYNTIAAMYMSGLFLTLIYGWYRHRSVVPMFLGLVIALHIAATTSIKTNLGVLLGMTVAALVYSRYMIAVLRRVALRLLILVGLTIYAVAASNDLVDRINAGLDRVSVGFQVLVAREDVQGNTSVGVREHWKDQGLAGWAHSPVFGNGVEAFRADYGVTSHSTPIDLLYNQGLIGFFLFYAVMLSIGWRMFRPGHPPFGNLSALLLGTLACYVFMSLSEPMYYDNFFAVFMAVATALLTLSESPADSPAVELGAAPQHQ